MGLTLAIISFFSIIESMEGDYVVQILPRSFLAPRETFGFTCSNYNWQYIEI